MTKRWKLLISMAVIPFALCFSLLSLSLAQQQQLRDDIEQLAVDLHAGMDRSTLTEPQKAQLRDDFRELRRAHQNHEMFATMRAARSIRTVLDSGAFKPEDRQRIKQDMQTIKEARESESNGLGMGPNRFRQFLDR
jgi:hypothetical protein